jgi:hypothetical protein
MKTGPDRKPSPVQPYFKKAEQVIQVVEGKTEKK